MTEAGAVNARLKESGSGHPATVHVAWLRFAAVIAVVAAVALLYWATVRSLTAEWENTDNLTYTHGYLVVLVSLWLLFRARREITAASIQPVQWAALALVGLGILWLVAFNAGVQIGHQLLFPVIMWMAVYAVFGWHTARPCLFPIGYLYFAIPIWSLGNGVLQSLSVYAARTLLRMFGIPAYFEGNFVQVPSGMFEIAGGCSGLHFFIVALALAALYGEMNRDTVRNRLLMIALAGVLAVVGNWVRIFTIIVAGHLTDMQHFLIRVDHYYFGWVVFGVAMVVFFAIANRIPAAIDDRAVRSAPMPPASITAGSKHFPAGILLSLLALVVPPVWGTALSSLGDEVYQGGVLPNVEQPDWRGPLPASGDWRPIYEGADAEGLGVYHADDGQVEVFTAIYLRQGQGKELTGLGNVLIDAGGWQAAPAPVLAGGTAFNEGIVSASTGREWVLWYTYIVGERTFTNGFAAQLWYGVAALAAPPKSRIVALRSECSSGCDAARNRLANFLEHVYGPAGAGY